MKVTASACLSFMALISCATSPRLELASFGPWARPSPLPVASLEAALLTATVRQVTSDQPAEWVVAHYSQPSDRPGCTAVDPPVTFGRPSYDLSALSVPTGVLID